MQLVQSEAWQAIAQEQNCIHMHNPSTVRFCHVRRQSLFLSIRSSAPSSFTVSVPSHSRILAYPLQTYWASRMANSTLASTSTSTSTARNPIEQSFP